MNAEGWVAAGEIRRLVAAALGAVMAFTAGSADAWDVFHTEDVVPPTPAGRLLADPAQCTFGAVAAPLTLAEAVERALCNNPRTRLAWAEIKAQSAAVGVSRAAYLPSLDASVQGVHDASSTRVAGHPEWSSSTRANIDTESASLNWLIYDFGGREAGLLSAAELLAAAQANHDAVLQAVFFSVGKDYYAAQTAAGAVAVASRVETAAERSFQVTAERVRSGVAPISDRLQAQTAFVQAGIDRTRAQGDLQNARGQLAFDMGLRSDFALQMPAAPEAATPDPEFDRSVEELLSQAERLHPSVLAAQAQLRAAQAKAELTHAQGLPSLSFVARSTRNSQPVTPSIGQRDVPATGRDWSVGLQLNIPLFQGFARSYQEAQARAEVETQRDTVDQVSNQAGLDAWTGFQTLQTAALNLGNSSRLLEAAQASAEATQVRYRSGVGSILEWLNAQSALAIAERQRLQATADWHTARLQLAAALGRLDMRLIAAR